MFSDLGQDGFICECMGQDDRIYVCQPMWSSEMEANFCQILLKTELFSKRSICEMRYYGKSMVFL